jgi:hypothetical protein
VNLAPPVPRKVIVSLSEFTIIIISACLIYTENAVSVTILEIPFTGDDA